ncbi:MAG TPA: hypothetical protein VGG16_06155 [Streptosporangiaceae bacterium]|jgi:hypothetical protein
MKFRAFALGTAMAAAATGLIPATAMASTTPVVSTGPAAAVGASAGAGASSGANAGASAGSGSSSSVSDKNNINVSVVTQLPPGYSWDNKKLYDDGRPVALPAGDRYADGGILGPDDKFYFAPSGKYDGVAVAPMRCQNGKYDYNKVSSGNFIGDIVDKALKACAGVYDAAYGLISDAFGGGSSSGYGSSSGC